MVARSSNAASLSRWPMVRVTAAACRRSEEHTSELQSLRHLVCRLLLIHPPSIFTLFPYTTLFRSCVEDLPGWVALGNTLPYVVGVLQALWHYQSPRVSISADGREIEQRCFVVAVANGPSYGGGMQEIGRAHV